MENLSSGILENCTHLKFLHAENLNTPKYIEDCVNLEKLVISNFNAKILEVISKFSKLTVLDLYDVDIDIELVSKCKKIRYLKLGSPNIISMKNIKKMRNLEVLDISSCEDVEDILEIIKSKSLQMVKISEELRESFSE